MTLTERLRSWLMFAAVAIAVLAVGMWPLPLHLLFDPSTLG